MIYAAFSFRFSVCHSQTATSVPRPSPRNGDTRRTAYIPAGHTRRSYKSRGDVRSVGAARQRLMDRRCKSDYELVCMDFKVAGRHGARSDSTTAHAQWDARAVSPRINCVAGAPAALCSRARSGSPSICGAYDVFLSIFVHKSRNNIRHNPHAAAVARRSPVD